MSRCSRGGVGSEVNNACACILACPCGAHACTGDGRVCPRHASKATREQ